MDSPEPHCPPAGTMDFLSFQLGGMEYGIDFAKVQELRILKSLERVAAGGEIVKGVVVSRGVIMPIVDMRAAFGAVRPGAADPFTDVIILKLSCCVMGMLVDGVTDLVSLAPHQIRPIAGLGGAPGQADYLIGLGEVAGRRLILVDIDKLMAIRRVRQAA
jgi:purine-binding chemotaxis protein CheW